jgi:hypothetical protein
VRSATSASMATDITWRSRAERERERGRAEEARSEGWTSVDARRSSAAAAAARARPRAPIEPPLQPRCLGYDEAGDDDRPDSHLGDEPLLDTAQPRTQTLSSSQHVCPQRKSGSLPMAFEWPGAAELFPSVIARRR